MAGVRSQELCRMLGETLLTTKAGMGTPKYIVVNDDIDITDLKELVWAFATRNHPGSQGEAVFNDEATNPLVAFLEESEKCLCTQRKCFITAGGDRLPKRSSFRGTHPEALQRQILDQ